MYECVVSSINNWEMKTIYIKAGLSTTINILKYDIKMWNNTSTLHQQNKFSCHSKNKAHI